MMFCVFLFIAGDQSLLLLYYGPEQWTL